MASYNDWLTAWNKDDLKFYADREFRSDYTRKEMNGKARMFKERALGDVAEALGEILNRTGRTAIRILSLGCGPGSDLLGVLGAVDSALPSWRAGQLRCDCIGVDAFNWSREAFEQQLNRSDFYRRLGPINCRFVLQDMDSFVLECPQLPSEFDFICLSFADAGRNLELVGTALPHLLSEFGRILVLDNDIPTVRRLADYGFTCTSAGYNVCMHSRGRGSRSCRDSFRPSPESPFRKYMYRRQEPCDSSFKVNQHIQRESSWCERNCSIL